jgi:hypothetical protein
MEGPLRENVPAFVVYLMRQFGSTLSAWALRTPTKPANCEVHPGRKGSQSPEMEVPRFFPLDTTGGLLTIRV